MGSAYYEVLRNLIFRSIQRETRLSERQVAQLRWEQIQGSTIVTQYHRVVQMSSELTNALALLPVRGNFVFIGSTPYDQRETAEMRQIRESFRAEMDSKSTRKFSFLGVRGH